MPSPVSLGFPQVQPPPPAPPPTAAPTWRSAWDEALYGGRGFFRRESPAGHFRTSVHASPLFAGSLLRLVRQAGLDTVVDVGAGRGELLSLLHRLDPTLQLLGVEVAPRPEGLTPGVDWSAALPTSVTGLVVANEWLDDIPCHVAEVDDHGVLRMLHVDPASGAEEHGHPVDHDGVPDSLREWCARWWPTGDAPPGTRVEIGTSRDAAWADVVGRLDRGVAVAVDYGHLAGERPAFGSLRSYRAGRLVDLAVDGSRDVTADVAVDAVAERSGAHLVRQREALHALGVHGGRPPVEQASADPEGYVAALARAGEAAELTDPAGLGGFWWVVTPVAGPGPHDVPLPAALAGPRPPATD